MKKVILMAIIATATFGCKRSAPLQDAPVRYYFKIEAVDIDDMQSTITKPKIITVN